MKSIYIELTHQCNLRCPHCYNMSGEDCTELNQEVLFDLFHAIGTDVSENWQIALSGGEPLMRKDILEILRECAKYSNIQVMLLTNGLLLGKITDEFLICAQPIGLQVSLDGMSKYSNDFIRGEGNFEKVTEHIRRLADLGYKKCNLKMTINKINYTEINGFVDFALENYCIPRFSFLTKQGNAQMNWDNLQLSAEKKITVLRNLNVILTKNLSKLRRLDSEITVKSMMPVISVACPLLDKEREISSAIKPNGDVQPCQELYDSFYTIGNIYEEDFLNIIDKKNNKKFLLVKEFLGARRELLRANKCKDCMAIEKCGMGCPSQTLSDTDSLTDLDSFCGMRRGMVNINMLFKRRERQ